MNSCVGPTVDHIWNIAMHMLCKFFRCVKNTTAYPLGQYSLHLLLPKTELYHKCTHQNRLCQNLKRCRNIIFENNLKINNSNDDNDEKMKKLPVFVILLISFATLLDKGQRTLFYFLFKKTTFYKKKWPNTASFWFFSFCSGTNFFQKSSSWL